MYTFGRSTALALPERDLQNLLARIMSRMARSLGGASSDTDDTSDNESASPAASALVCSHGRMHRWAHTPYTSVGPPHLHGMACTKGLQGSAKRLPVLLLRWRGHSCTEMHAHGKDRGVDALPPYVHSTLPSSDELFNASLPLVHLSKSRSTQRWICKQDTEDDVLKGSLRAPELCERMLALIDNAISSHAARVRAV